MLKASLKNCFPGTDQSHVHRAGHMAPGHKTNLPAPLFNQMGCDHKPRLDVVGPYAVVTAHPWGLGDITVQ